MDRERNRVSERNSRQVHVFSGLAPGLRDGARQEESQVTSVFQSFNRPAMITMLHAVVEIMKPKIKKRAAAVE
jgi:hypothetical protein